MAKLMTPMYRIIMRKKRRSDRGFIPNPLSADCDLIIYQSTKKYTRRAICVEFIHDFARICLFCPSSKKIILATNDVVKIG